uniref:Uncharacterized protein n=1 Tax=Parascaris univalens TaxID=6257 RepID=A0A915AU75_PARUN
MSTFTISPHYQSIKWENRLIFRLTCRCLLALVVMKIKGEQTPGRSCYNV